MKDTQKDTLEVLSEREFLVKQVKHPNAPTLDVGVGGCACLSLALALKGQKVVAIDIDGDALGEAREWVRENRCLPRVSFVRGDASVAPFRDGSLKNILAFNSLRHMKALESVVDEIHRVLSDDGCFLVSDFDGQKKRFLDRLEKALRGRFHKVKSIRHEGRMTYRCEK